jgi:hypothetical protein
MVRQILDTFGFLPHQGGGGRGSLLSQGGRLHFWIVATALLLPSCEEGRNFTLFGYTTCPQYDLTIHNVYVPIF